MNVDKLCTPANTDVPLVEFTAQDWQKTGNNLLAQLTEAKTYKEAVIDALVINHLGESLAKPPREALHDLICWEVCIALDPAVSKEAQALIEQATKEKSAEVDEWKRLYNISATTLRDTLRQVEELKAQLQELERINEAELRFKQKQGKL